MNATSPHRSEIGGCSGSGYFTIAAPTASYSIKFSRPRKNQELLLPAASDCAWVRAIAKDQRGRLDEEHLAEFNQSADLSTYRRKNSVRTTRATSPPSTITSPRTSWGI